MIKPKHSKRFFFWLDQHPPWNWKQRRLRLSGWCVARDGTLLTAMRARLRRKIFQVGLDREHPEITKYLAGAPASIRCGFVLDLKVPWRKTRLVLQAANANENWQDVFSTTICGPTIGGANDLQQWHEMNARMRYDFSFERPADLNQPVRTLYISGWCVDRAGEPIAGLRARIGSRTIPGNFGIERSDIAARYPNFPRAGQSGFAFAVPPRRKKSVLKIELRSGNGEWRQIFSREIPAASRSAKPDEVFAQPGIEYFPAGSPNRSRFQFWMDRPGDWSKKIRYLRVTGWCLATSGETVTAVRARIRKRIFTAKYGSVRPDVAVTFAQRPGALRSGFSLDAVVPRGPTTIVFEARSGDGPWETFFSRGITGPIFREEHDPAREEVGDYSAWIKKADRLTRRDREQILRHIAQFAQRPIISVLLPVYNSNPKYLRCAIESVRTQLYPHWELCVVDDASTDPAIWPLLEKLSRRDSRINIFRRSENGHICAASNDALRLATGEYVALLDHDDELAPTALYFVACELNRDPQLQLLYTDEDKLDKQGRRGDPYFKPDWSPDLFLGQNYISHLSVYSADLVRKVGGFRVGFEGSQDHDLTLRCVEQIAPAEIHHIPHVLYHWRADETSTASSVEAKPYAQESARRAVQQHLERSGIQGLVKPDYANYLRVQYTLPNKSPLVSIIIPTRDRALLLKKCLASIFEKTSYSNFELIVLDNESTERETLRYFASLASNPRVSIHRVEAPFNYSQLNNVGVARARGTFVLLLNNDIEVINASWLSEMVGQALRPEIGAVGARLWYPDKTMQHGGVIVGAGGIASHAHAGIRFEHGYFARAHLTQNFSAVTAACLLTKRDLYEQFGGFDETNLPVAFNDVDFCLRLREAGFQIVWTPHAELYHHESASRGFEDSTSKQVRFLTEADYMREKWKDVLPHDPFYNPNLSLGENLFTLAFRPRVTKPWQELR